MQTEMTIEAAIIELNRLKSQERMDIDRERLNAAIDKLIGAARYRIKQKPKPNIAKVKGFLMEFSCPRCGCIVYLIDKEGTKFIKMDCCSKCGQALDWSD